MLRRLGLLGALLVLPTAVLAYADLLARNGDPKFSSVPVQQLISKTHAASLCGKIDPNKAGPIAVPGGTDGGTYIVGVTDTSAVSAPSARTARTMTR